MKARCSSIEIVSAARAGKQSRPRNSDSERGWTFLTNHGHVLLCVSVSGHLTARELSMRIGITERSVQTILADLTDEGYLIKSKDGRRNVYTLNPKGRLRHPLEASHTVGELIEALS
ncbi:helix-turn-helix transcriptional regulator [Mycobacterium marinum]|uniref:helix-turn-helix transcriptional regulator n=1 Tax=Mycobacterium marinum TaxID=1781 RepID=UPI000B95DC8A|nr:winged helix-turn-helix domain-containing protein [Mycobacterium marinum]MDC8974356.1 winged helix-turn-helix domain-containing protein [Mycobacterium marinum]MDC8983098.1 winged helix-turn-helix domain-containing protein [Mycobacterium marinum]MDC8994380.1 winged helix-turn-helix domain-containing protein [Mycobacterium marinum]MDC9000108.1 winged helix-turn-helix domain-containing protein [Mycobacterium marinum]MDC9010491.1 winged helix-turn-helix domain-containing protein [Mycobacterium 